MDYRSVDLDYMPGKVVVSGASGRNGLTTLKMLMDVPEVRELVGLVRNTEKAEYVNAELRSHKERRSRHGYVEPIITDDPVRAGYAQIWINWKGVNLATLQGQNPELERDASSRGMHLRDMLIEPNVKIALNDAELARKYAPNCMYLQEGNPCDVLVRSVQKSGLPYGRVISTGTLMEYYRWTKLFSLEFPEISLDRATGLYIGEHGEMAVPVRERMMLGGLTAAEYVNHCHGNSGIERLNAIYDAVNDEAHWLRERLGKTPSEGPSAVTTDLVRMLLRPPGKQTIVGISTCVDRLYDFDLEEIGISVPVSVGAEGARIIPIRFSEGVMTAFQEAAEHIKKMNRIADEIQI